MAAATVIGICVLNKVHDAVHGGPIGLDHQAWQKCSSKIKSNFAKNTIQQSTKSMLTNLTNKKQEKSF